MGKSQIQTCFEKKEKDKVKHRAQYHLCTLNISTHRYIHKTGKMSTRARLIKRMHVKNPRTST